jgi:pimeloyl-ACP methyl ester carboxylesterase
MTALKDALDAFDPLGTPAYRRLLATRPGYQDFCDRKWNALSLEMWVALATELVRQPDQLDALTQVSCPTLVLVGEQDTPFRGVSQAMATAIPDATLVVVPDAGHSPQFENPAVWFDAVERFTRAHQRDAA